MREPLREAEGAERVPPDVGGLHQGGGRGAGGRLANQFERGHVALRLPDGHAGGERLARRKQREIQQHILRARVGGGGWQAQRAGDYVRASQRHAVGDEKTAPHGHSLRGLDTDKTGFEFLGHSRRLLRSQS